MVISLIAHERNLGLLSITDHLIHTLGKENCVVFGWNYLVSDYTSYLEKIKGVSEAKNIIVKYVIPRSRFSGEVPNYPKELDTLSDIVFRVPTYLEEISSNVPLTYFKGGDNPLVSRIKELYS